MIRPLCILLALAAPLFAQKEKEKKAKPEPAPFSWVSPGDPQRPKWQGCPETLVHATFESPSLGEKVGIYLPAAGI